MISKQREHGPEAMSQQAASRNVRCRSRCCKNQPDKQPYGLKGFNIDRALGS